jgi:hypothetical protein
MNERENENENEEEDEEEDEEEWKPVQRNACNPRLPAPC